ncbi:MAG: hypothetical protein H0U44_04685, partial [Flavisolibacter sp.]|nr:hypothetical protein [Flavisolibacter sp.]
FPFINLLWLGTIIMVIGILISMAWRIQTNKLKKVSISNQKRSGQKAGREEQAVKL